MGCASKRNQHGFTLVEISIVMIIIGLLIGGTFGGMKLIENMQVNKTVQDLKAIESAALTFKDTYGRLPGDIVNPAARLPNCTVAPCATGGNGDRRISPISSTTGWDVPQDAAFERFTFWSHLQAADMISVNSKNSTVLDFGEGQPNAPLNGGYRITEYTGAGFICGQQFKNGIILLTSSPDADMDDSANWLVSCQQLRSIDGKIDDGVQFQGKIISPVGCASSYVCTTSYDNLSSTGYLWYDAGF